MNKTVRNNLELYIDKDDLDKIRKCEDLYLKSAIIVSVVFDGKIDKSKDPYLWHLIRVSDRMTTLEGKVAGLLHDLVEDFDVTFDDLLDIGIPENIVSSLRLVTKEKSNKKLTKSEKLERYNKEIDKIINSGDDLAIELKIADMSDNSSSKRLDKVTIEDCVWFYIKYSENLKKLKEAREKRMIKC